jgi:hypothetical protein
LNFSGQAIQAYFNKSWTRNGEAVKTAPPKLEERAASESRIMMNKLYVPAAADTLIVLFTFVTWGMRMAWRSAGHAWADAKVSSFFRSLTPQPASARGQEVPRIRQPRLRMTQRYTVTGGDIAARARRSDQETTNFHIYQYCYRISCGKPATFFRLVWPITFERLVH